MPAFAASSHSYAGRVVSPVPSNALVVADLWKRFAGTQALGGVSFNVEIGQVLGIVGENGAGKSTLLNIICGCDRPDSGAIALRGKLVQAASYHEANRVGIFRIFQELSLIPNLAIYENIFLSHEAHFSRFGVLNKREMADRAGELFAELDHGWIDIRRPAGSYDFATRQAIEIVKAFALARLLNIDVPVLLLDEPTSALSRDEIAGFFRLVESVRDHAICVFVSHRLTEVLDLSDRLLVLKDGKVVTERKKAGVSEEVLHELMVGRARSEHFYKETQQRQPDEDVRLRASRLEGKGFSDVTLEIRRGEIVGIAGVMGSGKAELARCIAGVEPLRSGSIHVDRVNVLRPAIPTLLDLGLAYVTPDRGEEGIFPGLSVAWNISMARIARTPGLFLDPAGESAEAAGYVDRLRVKTAGIKVPARSLSGGNQQKLVMARWLAFGVKVLILDNPTRGVDAGAKEEIYELLRELAESGVAILLVSDDLLEVIGLANRIQVMKDGHIVREIGSPADNKPTESELVGMMV